MAERSAPPTPLPPVDLANRVGRVVGEDADYSLYEQIGRTARAQIEEVLPSGWRWDGRRTLDFGCGAGRTLRHFLPEAREGRGEFHGTDIDATSIEWLRRNLSPPLHGHVNREAPPLTFPDNHFDVIYAVSVFTHITDEWSAWLLEMRRLLGADGLLIASVLGEGMSRAIAGESWDESRVGMNVLAAGNPWDQGGPNVLMSPWWIRAHWGRAFEIVALDPGSAEGAQGLVALRPNGAELGRADLERSEPDEPRELRALRHNVRQLSRETADLRGWLGVEQARGAAQRERSERLERENRAVRESKSWRLTAPLRSLARARRER